MLTTFRTSLKAILATLASFIPMPIPTTDVGLIAWVGSIIALTGYPDNPSMRVAIYQMVLHLPPGRLYASKRGFIQQLRRSIANQNAFNLADDLKKLEKQKMLDEQQSRAKAITGEVV